MIFVIVGTKQAGLSNSITGFSSKLSLVCTSLFKMVQERQIKKKLLNSSSADKNTFLIKKKVNGERSDWFKLTERVQ